MFDKVLIPVDVSVPEDAHRLLNAAQEMTRTWNCACHVVTVIPNVGMPIVGSYFDENFENQRKSKVSQDFEALVTASGIDAARHVLTGTVYDNVINLANKLDIDLIIIGAHQPELRDYLLGSNAARVVRHAKQAVLVLRDAA